MTAPLAASRVPTALAANAALGAAAFIWGAFFPVMAELLKTWDPYTLTFARLVCGTAVLVAFLLVIEGPRAYSASLPWRQLFLLGLVGFGLFCVLITFGILYAGPIAAALVSATGPILAAFMAWVFSQRRPTRRAGWAAFMAVMGGVIVVFRDGAGEVRGGEIFVLGSTAAFVWYSLKVPEWVPKLSPIMITGHTVLAGTLALVPVYAIPAAAGWFEVRADFSVESILMVLYLSVMAVGVAAVLWNFGIKRIRAEIAAMYSNLCPLFAVLVSIAFGVYPAWADLLGGAMILFAILWVQRDSISGLRAR
jgi:drug/metabolite transporter (DMT)-like permease